MKAKQINDALHLPGTKRVKVMPEPKYDSQLQPSRQFTHEECATILAALRNWQDITSPEGGNNPRDLSSEHFEDGTEPLNTEQIDKLCEAINLQPIDKTATCEACHGQRWLIFTVDGSQYFRDGSLVVQRCDECSEMLSDDDAVTLARSQGLACKDDGQVTKRETKRWMKLYPNRGIAPRV